MAVLGTIPRAGAQGPLTPPGAPAPTMKTLAQVEPRIAITNVPFTINRPGSYYLTTNLTSTGHGIEIVSREMVAFEWLQRGGTELFREVNRDFIR